MTAPLTSRYVQSMQRICQYVDLPVPTAHPLFPSTPSEEADDDHVDRLSEAYASTSPFLQPESNPAYQKLLQQTERTQRHCISVKRHIGLTLWHALRKGKCLYCWLPRHMCMCHELWAAHLAYKAAQTPTTNSAVDVTMLLHAEEFLRTTNTAHLCAFILDCPMRVWGIPSDDEWLSSIGTIGSGNDNAASSPSTAVASSDANELSATQFVLLYPEEGCAQAADVMAALPPNKTTLHYVLSDGTWNQAHRVNRHVPRSVPRVALTIDPNYVSLFSSLRKQTRETGVSTLEATAMAVRQRLLQVGAATVADSLHNSLVSNMKQYVDKVCIQKRQSAVYASDKQKISEWTSERNAHDSWEYRTYHEDKEKQRVAKLLESLGNDLRKILPAPVVAYCYACDKYIGWSRMDSHVLGQQHHDMLAKNPTCEPSELSRRPEKGNWHVTIRHGQVPLQ